MGTRYSDAFNIKKKDTGKSVILKHREGLAEWWIYREKKSRFTDAFGKKLNTGETYLYCIVVCEDTNDGIRQQNEEYIAIEGVKFTNDDKGNDLDDYLNKTNRK
jgi:hypothetical protein